MLPEPASVALPTSDKPCPSTGKPTSTENSRGASLPVTKPFGLAGDAGGSTPPLAVRPGTQLPMAPSSTGASTLPSTPSSMALCPFDKSFASARGPKAVVNAGGALLPRRVKGVGASASDATLPLAGKPRVPLMPVAPSPTGVPSTMPGQQPRHRYPPTSCSDWPGGQEEQPKLVGPQPHWPSGQQWSMPPHCSHWLRGQEQGTMRHHCHHPQQSRRDPATPSTRQSRQPDHCHTPWHLQRGCFF
jgi:hypothetical protein